MKFTEWLSQLGSVEMPDEVVEAKPKETEVTPEVKPEPEVKKEPESILGEFKQESKKEPEVEGVVLNQEDSELFQTFVTSLKAGNLAIIDGQVVANSADLKSAKNDIVNNPEGSKTFKGAADLGLEIK